MLLHIGSATRAKRDVRGFCALDNLDASLAREAPGDRLL